MKRIFKQKSQLIAMLFVGLMIGCSSDDTAVLDTDNGGDGGGPTTPETATIRVTEGGASDDNFSAEAMGIAGETTPGRVIFTTTNSTQRRMYVTQQLPGEGAMIFDLPLTNKGTKADGSIDLDGDNRSALDFTFDLNVPSDISDGAIVYQFWTTTGKGDFRDPDKRNLLGDGTLNVGTITVTVGNGTNPAAGVRSFTGVQLFAPLADGSTPTFFSFLNEETYRIDVGPEFRAFWDFGYYYGAAGASAGNEASFASTSTYRASFGFDTMGLQPGADEDDSANETLNEGFFAKSNAFTAADFDNITMAGDLNSIVKPASQEVTNLAIGDIIEFEDNYGKKGLIRITNIQSGFTKDDFIQFDVKIQP